MKSNQVHRHRFSKLTNDKCKTHSLKGMNNLHYLLMHDSELGHEINSLANESPKTTYLIQSTFLHLVFYSSSFLFSSNLTSLMELISLSHIPPFSSFLQSHVSFIVKQWYMHNLDLLMARCCANCNDPPHCYDVTNSKTCNFNF